MQAKQYIPDDKGLAACEQQLAAKKAEAQRLVEDQAKRSRFDAWVKEAEEILGHTRSPVRFWTLTGAVSGLVGGFALAIGSALVNSLVAGGKHPVSIIPYCIVGFEGTILIGTLANLTGVLYHARLGRPRLPPAYDAAFMRDRFGLFVACLPDDVDAVRALVAPFGPESIRTL